MFHLNTPVYGGKMFKQSIKIFYDSMGIWISRVLNVKGSTFDKWCIRTLIDTYIFIWIKSKTF